MFPCQWNYRPDHCIYGSNCKEAEQSGVFILHGNRGVFHDDKQPAFRAVYEAIQKVELVSEAPQTLLTSLLGMITMASKTFLGGIEYISPYKGFGYVYDRHGHLKNQMQEEVTQNDFVSFADHFYRFFFPSASRPDYVEKHLPVIMLSIGSLGHCFSFMDASVYRCLINSLLNISVILSRLY